MYILFVTVKHLPLLSNVNLPLIEFTDFLQSTYKFCSVYKLAYRYFQICSIWTELHTELLFLKQITFLKITFS